MIHTVLNTLSVTDSFSDVVFPNDVVASSEAQLTIPAAVLRERQATGWS